MLTRILQTTGQGQFEETAWTKPPVSDTQIEVRAAMTGVCRSDIDMMQGRFGPLPIHMQGHEGLGVVTAIGQNITDVKVGDYVATRGEPAYADYYNAEAGTYVKVPELHQRYILEPVACGVNVVEQCIREIAERSGPNSNVLIMGSGFLSWVAYNTLLLNHIEFGCIDVLGSHNQDLWGDKLLFGTTESYDVVIDLSSSSDTADFVKNNGLIVQAAAKHPAIQTTYEQLLWKAVTMMFPSPRNDNFITCMRLANRWIQNGDLNVDNFWTRRYNRDTEWQQAFLDGVTRPADYSRGYIYWNISNHGN